MTDGYVHEYKGMCGTCRCDYGWECLLGKKPERCLKEGC